MGPTAAAAFCATLVDEWVRAGCTHAVVAPGSRSTPLALALAADRRVAVHVFHDERAAGFAALGVGRATGRPAPVVCTSGTAAVHLHAAVVEASLSDVPMLVCTADRPPELWHVGAPQTIEQTRLYGPAVRWFAEPGVPDDATRDLWRSLAARAVAEGLGASGRPGPVHLNLSFRDPLVGRPGDLPAGRPGGGPWHHWSPAPVEPSPDQLDQLAAVVSGRTGVVVAGAGTGDPCGVEALAMALGWPVLADPRSGCRGLPVAVRHADPILRHAGPRDQGVEVVLRLGEAHASRVLSRWLAATGAHHVAVDRHGRWRDPERLVDTVVQAEPGRLAAALAPRVAGPPVGQLDRWLAADDAAGRAIARVLGSMEAVTEPATVRSSLDATPAGGALVVASSMPVRDLEWFGGAGHDGVVVHANRGANGIDGVVATAIGVAVAGRPTVCVVGDVAFLHDSTALVALAGRDVALTVVVIDNDGGGIFSFLPQANDVAADRFELLFGTPHGTDLAGLAAAHRLPVAEPQDPAGVAHAIAAGVAGGRPNVVRVRTDRSANVALHARLERAVGDALG